MCYIGPLFAIGEKRYCLGRVLRQKPSSVAHLLYHIVYIVRQAGS